MRGEEIANCKIHMASVCLSNWCIMIFLVFKKKKEWPSGYYIVVSVKGSAHDIDLSLMTVNQ